MARPSADTTGARERRPGRRRRVDRLDRHPDPRRRRGPSRTATRSSALGVGSSVDAAGRPGPRVPAQGGRRGRRRRAGPRWPSALPVRRGGRPTSPTWPPTPTWWSTASSASPACRSPSRRCGPASGWRWPTRSRSSPPGPVVQPLRSTPGAELVPVDSEHCAVHQCLRAGAGARPRAEPHRAHGQRRPVPGPHGAPTWPTVTVGRRAGPSDLGDGTEDHRRLLAR